jgi:hypothetical protein
VLDGLPGEFASFRVDPEQLLIVECALESCEVCLGLMGFPESFLIRNVATEPVRLILEVAG